MLGIFKRNREKNKEKTQEGVQKSRATWFGRIMDVLRSRRLDDEVWEELEEILISADVGVDTSLSLIERLKTQAREERLTEPQQVFDALKSELAGKLASTNGREDLWLDTDTDNEAKPFVILVVGVNGVGKTTSIAKLAHNFNEAGKRVVLGAADTFRAAAIDQLQVLGERVGVDVIAHQPGADPGAVAYDAFQASKARGADVLIIDTAGRLHTKANLMEELKKIRRVLGRLDPSAPHQVLLILDATTGMNGLSQARAFKEAVDCTGIFLAKLDGTAKGGIVLAIENALDLPILFIGTGEKPQDMAPFDSRDFVEALLEPVGN
jgi:fused signal recognition particle receptor